MDKDERMLSINGWCMAQCSCRSIPLVVVYKLREMPNNQKWSPVIS